MSHAIADHPVTVAEFERFMERQPPDTRWELLDGQILAMTNPSEDHGQIVHNIVRGVGDTGRERGCRVNIGGLRVQASDAAGGTTATIPDMTVRCGPRVGRNWIDDPVIVVEVLSPSTMDFDRGGKLDFYRSLQSARDIVLVYQDQVRVEHYRREGEGWAMLPLTQLADPLTLDGVPCSIGLADIYADTALTE